MTRTLPSLLVTGASGIVGKYFLEAARDDYRIYAMARRSQRQAEIPEHPNIRWIQVDIGNAQAMRQVTLRLQEEDGVDFVLHLAAYYDFEYEEHPAYDRINVRGTELILELARTLGIDHFILASTLAACEFPPDGWALTEKDPPDADYPYARSKKRCEELVEKSSRDFRCSVVRLAAVYSDWCEFAPLYVLLSTWLSGRWNARMVGGRGESALPYIHTRDLSRFFLTLLKLTPELPRHGIYLASPDGCTSHREIFDIATRFHFGRAVTPVHMPRTLAMPGVALLDLLGRLRGERPFERPWMVRYFDRKLNVDASRTRQILQWNPIPRHHLLRRILFLIEKMKSHPDEWRYKNAVAMRRIHAWPNLILHDALVAARDSLIGRMVARLHASDESDRFSHYQQMSELELRSYMGLIFEVIIAAVRTGDRTLLLNYVADLSRRRFEKGFPPSEVCDALLVINDILVDALLSNPELAGMEGQVHDFLTLTVRLGVDGVQDAYEDLMKEKPAFVVLSEGAAESGQREQDLEKVIEGLKAYYRRSSNAKELPDRGSAASGGEKP